jgi:hypothetical protein
VKITILTTREVDVPSGKECLSYAKKDACQHRYLDYCLVFSARLKVIRRLTIVRRAFKCAECLACKQK